MVGPNGARKTTIFNLLTGFLKASEGSVIFKKTDITDCRPDGHRSDGPVRTFQLNKVFPGLTVEQNIRIGCHKYEKGGIRSFLFNPPKRVTEAFQERVDRSFRWWGYKTS